MSRFVRVVTRFHANRDTDECSHHNLEPRRSEIPLVRGYETSIDDGFNY